MEQETQLDRLLQSLTCDNWRRLSGGVDAYPKVIYHIIHMYAFRDVVALTTTKALKVVHICRVQLNEQALELRV